MEKESRNAFYNPTSTSTSQSSSLSTEEQPPVYLSMYKDNTENSNTNYFVPEETTYIDTVDYSDQTAPAEEDFDSYLDGARLVATAQGAILPFSEKVIIIVLTLIAIAGIIWGIMKFNLYRPNKNPIKSEIEPLPEDTINTIDTESEVK